MGPRDARRRLHHQRHVGRRPRPQGLPHCGAPARRRYVRARTRALAPTHPVPSCPAPSPGGFLPPDGNPQRLSAVFASRFGPHCCRCGVLPADDDGIVIAGIHTNDTHTPAYTHTHTPTSIPTPPPPPGLVTHKQALGFLAAQLSVGLGVLLQLNPCANPAQDWRLLLACVACLRRPCVGTGVPIDVLLSAAA